MLDSNGQDQKLRQTDFAWSCTTFKCAQLTSSPSGWF